MDWVLESEIDLVLESEIDLVLESEMDLVLESVSGDHCQTPQPASPSSLR
jgi:hypothetical protein